MPPLICFAHGSLGYLCNFLFDEFESVLKNLISSDAAILHLDNRLRLKVGVMGNPVRDVFTGNSFSDPKKMTI